MADDKKKPDATPAGAGQATGAGLSVRSIRVVPDPYNRSPGGMAMDIVEVEFYPLGEGNSIHWMQWADLARFRCERGQADKVLAGLGLKLKA